MTKTNLNVLLAILALLALFAQIFGKESITVLILWICLIISSFKKQ